MDTRQTAAVDPVCGMTVDPASAAGSSEHTGQTYWFCSAGCKQRFDADPEKHLSSASSDHAPHRLAAHAHGASAATAQPMVQLGMKRPLAKSAAHGAHDHASHANGAGAAKTQPV